MSASQVLEIARSQLGTVESPPGSNRTRYGAAYGLNGVPWCAQFVWWVFYQAGDSALIPKTAYTPALADWFKGRGQWGDAPRPGALALFDFLGDGVNRISHVGLVEAVNPDGTVITIEGNTSGGAAGSQRDGGGVWRRTRKAGIVGYAYPAYPVPAPPAAPVDVVGPVLAEGSTGAAVAKLQTFLRLTFPGYAGGLTPDGVFGPATRAVVVEFQRRVGLAADGIVGPTTTRELGKYGYRP